MSQLQASQSKEDSPLASAFFYGSLSCIFAFWGYNAGRRSMPETLSSMIPEYVLFAFAMLGAAFIFGWGIAEYAMNKFKLTDMLTVLFLAGCTLVCQPMMLGDQEPLAQYRFWGLVLIVTICMISTIVHTCRIFLDSSLILEPPRR